MGALPTLRIVNPKRPEEGLVINAQDFDPATHTRWEDRGRLQAQPTPPSRPAETEVPAQAIAPSAEEPSTLQAAVASCLDPDHPERRTARGLPRLEALERILGRTVTVAERDQALAKAKARHA